MASPLDEAWCQSSVNSRRCPLDGKTNKTASNGKALLIVEDNSSLAGLICEILLEVGYDIVGPAATSRVATELVVERQPDAVLLDISLADGPSFPLAELLSARGVPFAFMTGYNSTAIPRQLRGLPLLIKPMSFDRLLNVVMALCGTVGELADPATITSE